MANWSGEEVAEGVERFLKHCRDEYPKNSPEWTALDNTLNDTREAAAEGWLPWQRLGSDG